MRCLAGTLLALSLCFGASRQVELPSGGSIRFFVRNAQTVFEIHLPGAQPERLAVNRDATVADFSPPSSVTIVGERKGVAIVLVDTYPSVPVGMSYCQAGKEKFLRIIAIAQSPPRETVKVKLESCRQNIELASAGLQWLPNPSTIRINWLRGPSQLEEAREILIGPNGEPAK